MADRMDPPGPARKSSLILQTADVRIVEYVLDSGDVHPWHYHSEVSDTFYCLDGLIGIETREPPSEVVLRPGEKGIVPPQVVHHVSNASAGRSRYLLIQGIGTYDYIRVD
jgi:quercetin dioxygenase-like cupin family protein